MPEPVEHLVGFARDLRDEGVAIGTGRTREFCRAAALAGAEHLYWAGRATLLGRPADVPVYDTVFARWFGEEEPLPVPSARIHVEADALGRAARASRDEALRRKSFATLEPD